MSDNLTPLAVCERLIGTKPELAALCGYDRTAAYHWDRPAKDRPAGHLPLAVQSRLWRHVKAKKLPIPGHWLIEGAPLKDVLAARDAIRAATDEAAA